MAWENDFWPHFSEEEYRSRYGRIRAAMREKGLDLLLIYGNHTFFATEPGQPNVVYVASYAAFYQSYVVFPLEGEPTLIITWAGHLKNAKSITAIKDVRAPAGFRVAEKVVERVKELGLERARLGIVGSWGFVNVSIPYEHWCTFKEELPGAEISIETAMYEELRLIKSAEEISFIERAAGISDKAHEALNNTIEPGKTTDNDLFNVLLTTVHSLGGRMPFGHVESAPMNEADMVYPNPYALKRTVQRGDVVMTEVAGCYGGYGAKIWGTVFVGEPTEEYRRLFQAAAASNRAMKEAIRPGLTPEGVKDAMMEPALREGLIPRSLIHGWSNYNQAPRAGVERRDGEYFIADGDYVFKEGNVFTIVGWATSPDGRRAAWCGDTGILTSEGIRCPHAYRCDEIKVI